MKNPKVSIVIPVYNREKCISVCIESILKSEYPFFEIIIIDDGSTDSSFSIIENIAKKDSRIKYCHQENAGVSEARNRGLSLCTGEWVTFVDSDDVILPSHLNVFFYEKVNGVDLLMTDFTSGRLDNGEIKVNHNKKNKGAVTAPSCGKYLFCDYKPFENPVYPVWNKFFRLQMIIINDLRFDRTMSLGEDQVFLCNYLLYAKGGICHFRQSTYVNLHWNDISHLGSVLRLPSNYLYNQKRNYYSLCALIPLYGNCVKAYAVDYGINRPITRILYNYTKAQKSCLLQKGELKQFVKNEIIPFISSIDTSVYTVRNRNVRFVRFLLLNAGANIAIKYCYIYNVVNSCPKLIKSICKKIYKTINDKHNRQA